jgi:hypothetical protein
MAACSQTHMYLRKAHALVRDVFHIVDRAPGCSYYL